MIEQMKENQRMLESHPKENSSYSNRTEEDGTADIKMQFLMIPKCSILKYGIKTSKEMIPYGYCTTCDINLIHPICSECLQKCHKHHLLKECGKAHIICGCGERLHKFDSRSTRTEEIKFSLCPYSDWCELSGVSTVYLVDTKPICLFCYELCGVEGGFTLAPENEMESSCQCEEIQGGQAHRDLKAIFHKMNVLSSDSSNLMKELGPMKLLNLLFLGKVSYDLLFSSFDEMIIEFHKLKSPNEYNILNNFTETNFFLSLTIFSGIAQKIKNTPLRYFSNVLCEKLSFACVTKVIKFIRYKESQALWSFLESLLFIFKKITIGNETKTMDKFKLYDFENLSFIQRIFLFHTNKSKIFTGALHQVAFFIDTLAYYLNSVITLVNGYDIIIQICSILKRMSGFYLFSSKEMIQFCLQFEKCFDFIKRYPNFNKQLQLFYIVIKMIHWFIYHYNDEILYQYLNQPELLKEEDIKPHFIFSKNELGRLISRNVIRMMFFCTENLEKEVNYDQKKIIQKILQHGMTIISFLIGSKDSYMMSLNKLTKHCPEYLELIKVNSSNAVFDQIQKEQTLLEDNYQKYYTFVISQNDLITNIDTIIDKVMNHISFSDIRPFILKSNFYFSLIKILYIIQFSYESEQHQALIGKIFNLLTYLIANNSDNAILVLSHYFLVGLMKLPFQYAKSNLTLFLSCCELISSVDSVLIYPKEILRSLCVYLINLKENYQNQNEEMNSLLSLYLTVIKQISLNTLSLNEEITKTVTKQIIIKLLKEFKLKSIDTNNIATFLQIANAIFDSSNCYDREILQNIFSIDYLIGELDNLSIKLDYRMEILRFVKKNKLDIYFEEDEIKEQSMSNSDSSELLSEKSNDYLNAFVSNEDNFEHIKNSPLISNYQFPAKYLTFYYDIIKMNKPKAAKSQIAFEREAFDLYIKELKRIKSIFMVHVSDVHVFVHYLAKGIFIPLISIIKKALCFTHLASGKQILILYNMALSILFIKKWIFTLDQEFKAAVASIEIPNFNLLLLLSEEHKAKCNLDYDDLNDKIKYSPFDYTHLYTVFQCHLFCFVTYPKPLLLSEQFNSNSNGLSFDSSSSANNKSLLSTQSNFINPLIVEKNIKTLFNSYNKMKNEINSENSSLFISLSEICIEYEKNFRCLLISLAICLSLESEQFESDCYIIIFKLLSIQTVETQNDIIAYLGGKKSIDLNFLLDFSDKLYEIIVKIFINDFSGETHNDESLQTISFNLIKLFKYLCEEHNNFFQTKILSKLDYEYHQWSSTDLVEEEEFQQRLTSMTFFNFLLNVIIKILLISNKAKDEAHMGFLFDLYFSIVELLIEIVQGNKEEIITTSTIKTKKELLKNENSLATFKDFAQVASEIILDDCLINKYSFKVKLQLMSFFIAILEEKTNDSLQKIIMKFLTLKKVLDSILFTLKNYFYSNTKAQRTFVKYYSDYSEKQIYGKEFKFDYVLFNYFKLKYFHSEFSKNCEEFQLANNYYRYIKILSINGKSSEVTSLIKLVEGISENESIKRFMQYNTKLIIKPNEVVPINLTNEKEKTINSEFIEHYYVIKFFESITQVVEIYIQEEKRNQLVIFTIPSEMIYLSEMTKVEFLNNVDRESETSKKSELLRSISLFQKEIKYFKKTNLNWFIRFVIRLDYVYVQIFVYLFAVGIIILMVLTLKGYTQKEAEPLRALYEIDQKYIYAIDQSILEWGIILDTLTYILVIMIGFLIFSWIFIKMPLYYRLDKIKYIKANNLQSKKQLTFFNKVYIALVLSIFDRDYINTLLYMFVVALIASIMDRGEIVYPFLLIAIVNLNPTLKSIIKAIQMRYMELISVFLLMLIMIYFYSNIGFFFFNSNFERVVEGIDDNLCKSLVFCFLTLVDAGVRARGGAGDQMIRISYERNMVNYVERLFYDVTYFLIVIILMIDLVFGIIIGTFSEMRNEEIKYQIDKENHCFICHITRETIEQQRHDFTNHREVTHNLWSYVNYMIFLKFSFIQDLNAFNSYAKEHLEKNNICFLPSAITSYSRGDKAEREEPEGTNEENEESETSDNKSYQEKQCKGEESKQKMLIQDLRLNNNKNQH